MVVRTVYARDGGVLLRPLGLTTADGHTGRVSYWEGPSRWINALLLFILGFIGFDTFFRLLNARASNPIVGGVRAIASLFLAPFAGMFEGQSDLVTALIAVVGYCLLAGIALAIAKTVQVSRREAALHGDRRSPERTPIAAERTEDRTQRL
jgi:hypothetical protein